MIIQNINWSELLVELTEFNITLGIDKNNSYHIIKFIKDKLEENAINTVPDNVSQN